MLNRKRYTLALALLLAVGCVIVAYVNGLPVFLLTLLDRPVADLSQEDYKVYSAFVDDFFPSPKKGGISEIDPGNEIPVSNETLSFKNESAPVLPLNVVALGAEDAGRDFFRQNTTRWPLQPRFSANRKVVLVGNSTPHGPMWNVTGEAPSCRLWISRVGFSRNRKQALLYYHFACGSSCCSSSWVLLTKDADRWKIKDFGAGIMY
jgi:hypothetical protein